MGRQVDEQGLAQLPLGLCYGLRKNIRRLLVLRIAAPVVTHMRNILMKRRSVVSIGFLLRLRAVTGFVSFADPTRCIVKWIIGAVVLLITHAHSSPYSAGARSNGQAAFDQATSSTSDATRLDRADTQSCRPRFAAGSQPAELRFV